MDALNELEPHLAWLAIGLVLAGAEMAIPGMFLIWMAGAALCTGLTVWLLPIGLPLQILLFAGLSIAAVFLGRKYITRHPVVGADPLMNQRAVRSVGQTVVVTEAIVGGSGRVRLGDSEWLARGEDAAPGTRLKIVDTDGVVLIVAPLAP